jgi:hypothetical protein
MISPTRKHRLRDLIRALPEEDRVTLLRELLELEAAGAEISCAHHDSLHYIAAVEALDADHEPVSCPLLAATIAPAERDKRLRLLALMGSQS